MHPSVCWSVYPSIVYCRCRQVQMRNNQEQESQWDLRRLHQSGASKRSNERWGSKVSGMKLMVKLSLHLLQLLSCMSSLMMMHTHGQLRTGSDICCMVKATAFIRRSSGGAGGACCPTQTRTMHLRAKVNNSTSHIQ